MSATLDTVLFFVVMILVPFGIITGIVLAVVNRSRGKSALKALSDQLGLEYSGSSPDAIESLNRILVPTLFATRKGRHLVRSTANGIVEGSSIWVAEYHYTSPGYRSQRAGGAYALLVLERESEGPELMVIYRQTGSLAAVAETLAEDQLVEARDDEWSWALTTSNEALAALSSPAGAGRDLGSAGAPGDFFFFFPRHIMWARSGELSRRWTEKVPDMLSILRRFG